MFQLRGVPAADVLVVFIVVLVSSDGDRKAPAAARIVVIVIAIALIALAWLLSQSDPFCAVAVARIPGRCGSVELTKNPDAMISALRKIEDRGELPGATSAVMEMCVDNPREGFADLFATHPSVEFPGAGAGEIRRRARSPAAGFAARYGRWAGRSAARAGQRPSPATFAVRSMERPEGPRRIARRVTRPLVNPAGPWGRHLTAPCRGREYENRADLRRPEQGPYVNDTGRIDPDSHLMI